MFKDHEKLSLKCLICSRPLGRGRQSNKPGAGLRLLVPGTKGGGSVLTIRP